VPSRPAGHRHGGRPELALSPSQANLRAFVRRHTRVVDVPDLPGIRLSLADDVTATWRLAGRELGDADPPLPFWAFVWAGGLAVSRYLVENPDVVAGRDVVDVASGSGLCAIVAARCGAASVRAFDVDPLAAAAVSVNSRANDAHVSISLRDPLVEPPPRCDVILAGDVCYEEAMARRMHEWLGRAAGRGTLVLLGDPGRRYLPAGLEPLATYWVRTSRELEPAEALESAVYEVRG
jgi:predicted nicotinamide N-methyase